MMIALLALLLATPDLAAPLADARAHLVAGRAAEAQAAHEAILRSDPRNAAAHNALGSIHNSAGRYAAALPHAQAAVAGEPANPVYRLNRGIVFNEHGRFADAIADLDIALAARPEIATGWLERGAAAFALGRDEEARADWAKARAAGPDLIWTHWYPATADLVEGRFAEAAAGFDRVAVAEPGFAATQLWRAIAHARTGTPVTLVPVKGKDWPAPLIDLYAGRATERDVLALAAADRDSGDARRTGETLLVLGQRALAAGRGSQAATYFRRAVAVQAPRHIWKQLAARELARLT